MGMRKGLMAVGVLAAAFAGGFVAQRLAGTAAHAAEPGNVLRAKAFVVVDDAGREHAVLGAHPQGMGLVVNDAEGNSRMVLGMLPEDQVGIVITAADQETQVALGAWADTNHLDLYDGAGKPRFTVGVGRDGRNAGLAFYDEQRAERLAIGMGPGGGGDFVAKDEFGTDVWRASRTPQNPPEQAGSP